jgi:hypothetical protein
VSGWRVKLMPTSQRHQEGQQNQDDNKAAVIAFQVKLQPTFSTRPDEFPARRSCVRKGVVFRFTHWVPLSTWHDLREMPCFQWVGANRMLKGSESIGK